VLDPDLAFFVDVEPKKVIGRLKLKRSIMEKLDVQRKVQKIYMKFVMEGKLIKIDGALSKQEVAKTLLKVVLEALKKSQFSS
jgi:thymidylate kinase